MSGLFFDIQGYFDATYDGRFVETLLRELTRHEPSSMACVIGEAELPDRHNWVARLRTGRCLAQKEKKYDRGRRLVDLFIEYEKQELLIEIKVEDGADTEHNIGQLDAYIDYVRRQKGRASFLYLDRYYPSVAVEKRIRTAQAAGLQVGLTTFANVHRSLPKYPMAQMLREYIEDIGMPVYTQISLAEKGRRYVPSSDGKALTWMATQVLNLPDRNGFGRLESAYATERMPDLMRLNWNNVAWMSDWVRQANRDVITPRFSQRIHSAANIQASSLRKFVDNAEDEIINIPPSLVTGGTVGFNGVGTVYRDDRKNENLYLEIGVWFHIERGCKKPLIRGSFGAGFSWRGIDRIVRDKVWIDGDEWIEYPSEAEATKALRNLLTRAHKSARLNAPAVYRPYLAKFMVPS